MISHEISCQLTGGIVFNRLSVWFDNQIKSLNETDNLFLTHAPN